MKEIFKYKDSSIFKVVEHNNELLLAYEDSESEIQLVKLDSFKDIFKYLDYNNLQAMSIDLKDLNLFIDNELIIRDSDYYYKSFIHDILFERVEQLVKQYIIDNKKQIIKNDKNPKYLNLIEYIEFDFEHHNIEITPESDYKFDIFETVNCDMNVFKDLIDYDKLGEIAAKISRSKNKREGFTIICSQYIDDYIDFDHSPIFMPIGAYDNVSLYQIFDNKYWDGDYHNFIKKK